MASATMPLSMMSRQGYPLACLPSWPLHCTALEVVMKALYTFVHTGLSCTVPVAVVLMALIGCSGIHTVPGVPTPGCPVMQTKNFMLEGLLRRTVVQYAPQNSKYTN